MPPLGMDGSDGVIVVARRRKRLSTADPEKVSDGKKVGGLFSKP